MLRDDPSSPFPETEESVLAQAAGGDWERFLRAYIEPCWREMLIVCRQRGISLVDGEDLFQSLMLRLLQEGRTRLPGGDDGQAASITGNLPARYVQYCRRQTESVRFRTYLKGTIVNIVREALRKQARRAEQPLIDQYPAIEPELEESITQSLERHWLSECLYETARQFQELSRAQRTRGRRRLYDVLYRSIVDDQSPGFIAQQYGIDRSTVARLLTDARKQFVSLLQQVTGIDDPADLKRMLSHEPRLLQQALARGQATVS